MIVKTKHIKSFS